jgi:hypothetical protein
LGDQIKKPVIGRHVAHTANGRGSSGFWWGDLRERDHLEELSIGESIIVQWTFKIQMGS